MVFSSIPSYALDPPNWHQQQNHHQANGNENTQFLPPLPPQVGGTSGGNSIRPGSMADRARLAKIPPPETALKCPRCDSTNTKFCYFNNYSLAQPRHFCKTCRRYWTRGGALRNVPVGGGCRRNKKNKRSRSKSPEKQTLITTSSVNLNPSQDMVSQLPQPHNLPFMASLQNLNRYAVGNMGLADHMGFQMGGSNSNSSASASVAAAAGSGVDQWRLQQFPFLNTFEENSGGSYPFQGESIGFVGDSRVTQQPPVKMEENGGLNNLTRSSVSVSEQQNNDQYYLWTDLSGLAPSTTHDLL